MGEAAALCDAAGLLPMFRSAVLKLDANLDKDGAVPTARQGACACKETSRSGAEGRACRSRCDRSTRASPVSAVAGVADESSPDDEAMYETAVRIDHMNDRLGYVKLLSRWVSQLGLAARLWFSVCSVDTEP